MNKLSAERRAQVLGMMVEGNRIRAIVRMTGVSKNTIVKLLEDAGGAFSAYQDRVLRNLPCKRLQLDEIWAFCYAKQRNVLLSKSAPEGAGDIWTWVAVDGETKLVPSWRIGVKKRAPAPEPRLSHAAADLRRGPVGMWTIGVADRLRFPRIPSQLGKRGNARLRPHTHRHRSQQRIRYR